MGEVEFLKELVPRMVNEGTPQVIDCMHVTTSLQGEVKRASNKLHQANSTILTMKKGERKLRDQMKQHTRGGDLHLEASGQMLLQGERRAEKKIVGGNKCSELEQDRVTQAVESGVQRGKGGNDHLEGRSREAQEGF